MYADDTVINFSANCCQNIEYHLNADLANLAEWFNNNYLTLNTSKSKFVMFGGDRRLQTCQGIKLVIDHENLDSKDSIKYLGVANNFTCLLLRSWNTLHTRSERVLSCYNKWTSSCLVSRFRWFTISNNSLSTFSVLIKKGKHCSILTSNGKLSVILSESKGKLFLSHSTLR